jgi:hypothetical protein
MRLALALAVVLGAFTAQADIPPQHPAQIENGSIGAAESAVLFAAIPGDAILIASLRTKSSSGKVLRSVDGLNQVICISTSSFGIDPNQKSSVSCSTQKSVNGVALPVFRPARIMG